MTCSFGFHYYNIGYSKWTKFPNELKEVVIVVSYIVVINVGYGCSYIITHFQCYLCQGYATYMAGWLYRLKRNIKKSFLMNRNGICRQQNVRTEHTSRGLKIIPSGINAAFLTHTLKQK